MDIEYIKEKIYNLDEQRKIQPGEYLSSEVIELLQKGNTTSRTACFSKTADTSPAKNVCVFPSELTCSCCGSITIQSISKTHLLNYLQGRNKIVCDNCKDKIDAEKLTKKEITLHDKEKRKHEVKKNTEQYIEMYLDPKKIWSKDLSSKERTHLIINQKGVVDYNIISKYIKSLSYQEFLCTPYWQAISEYKKFKSDYKCALCGNNTELATHHNSYKNHGREHEYEVIEKDLIVLCKDCHNKFHDHC